MQSFWITLIVAGMATVLGAQVVAAALCFRLSPARCLASLVVPGYLFVGTRQTAYYMHMIGLWACGIAAIVAGTLALT